ncbi:unnamed protein product [Mucor hiemalis]
MTEKATNNEKTAVSSSPTTPTTPGGSFFKSSFFSNVTSSVSSFSQTIQTKGLPEINKKFNEFQSRGLPEINKKFNEFQKRALQLPGQLATLQGDLEAERASFIQLSKSGQGGTHRTNSSKGSVPVAPWEGYRGYEKEMKRAIMEISEDERNFLIPPPEDTSFQFDLNAYSQTAQAALKQDKKLSEMRFLLVPQQKQAENVLFDFKDDDDSEVEEEDVVIVKKKDVLPVENKKETTQSPSPKPQPITTTSKTVEKEEKKQEDNTNYEGMEEWEIELRKAAIL